MVIAPVTLGARQDPPALLDLLHDCHARIRRFGAMAGSIAAADDAADAEVRDAALAVARYFREALPLHVADEEHSIAPRLHGVDAALAAMHREHEAHGPLVADLIETCTRVAEAPARRAELAAPAAAAVAAFEAHLADEERTIFPAIARLSAEDQAAIVAELRARRGTISRTPA